MPRKPKPASKPKPAAPRLLSDGNPQITKAEGDASVQAYIAALPSWKSAVATRIDALIVREVPGFAKAVKYNSPLYGVPGRGWFLGLHAFTHYLKLAFFRGTALTPPPSGLSKSGDTGYLDVRAGAQLDEAQLAAWIRQAAELPGWDGK